MSIAPPLRLNKTTVDALLPRAIEYVAWDSALPGFGVRVHPSGMKTYLLHVRVHGTQRKARLGRHGVVTTEQARYDARLRLADLQRSIVVDRTPPPRVTFAELAARYLAEHAATRKKASSARLDRTNLRLHLLPRLAPLPLDTITPAEVLALHHAMDATPVAANCCLSLLATMFGLARRWGLHVGDNPAQDVAPYRERRRDTMLTAAHRRRVLKALIGGTEQTWYVYGDDDEDVAHKLPRVHRYIQELRKKFGGEEVASPPLQPVAVPQAGGQDPKEIHGPSAPASTARNTT